MTITHRAIGSPVLINSIRVQYDFDWVVSESLSSVMDSNGSGPVVIKHTLSESRFTKTILNGQSI